MPITAVGFLLVFIIGSLATLKKPFVGLLLYFFVFYMHPPAKYWGAFLPEMRWTLIVAILTIISTLIHVKDLTAWLKPKESKVLMFFFVYVCVQSLWVEFPSIHQIYLILLFKFILLFFLLLTLVTSEKKMIAIVIVNALGASYIGLNAVQTHLGGRFEAAGLPSIEDGNLLSIHLIPVILISSVIILTTMKRKFLILIPLALVAHLLFLTGSRGGVVGLVASGCVLLWYAPRQKKAQLYKWAFIAVILGGSLAGPILMDRIKQVTNVEQTEDVDKSAYSRFVVIESQWEMFKDNMFLGVGHRGTLILSPYYIPEEYMTKTAKGAVRGSHNLTMSIMVDHGIIGSFLVFFLMYISLKKLKKVNKGYSHAPIPALFLLASGAGLTGVIVSSQFSNSKVLEISIWLIAFIIINNNLIQKKNLESNST
jgi:hypothetical protein